MESRRSATAATRFLYLAYSSGTRTVRGSRCVWRRDVATDSCGHTVRWVSSLQRIRRFSYVSDRCFSTAGGEFGISTAIT